MSTHLPLYNQCTGCGGLIEQARLNIIGPDVELCASCAHYQEVLNKYENQNPYLLKCGGFGSVVVPRDVEDGPLLTAAILFDEPRSVSVPWAPWSYVPESDTVNMEVCFDGTLWVDEPSLSSC